MDAMTRAELEQDGAALRINYHFCASQFGQVLIAATPKGVCHLHFVDDDALALNQLAQAFPKAQLQPQRDALQDAALAALQQNEQQLAPVKLHLKATAFQLNVWQALLDIPLGQVRSYGALAKQLQQPKAARAVGTAIGRNPIAFLIPCHRVITASGTLGGYRWGEARKRMLLDWEIAQGA